MQYPSTLGRSLNAADEDGTAKPQPQSETALTV